MQTFSWNSLAFSMVQQMFAFWSLIPLPFLNPACTSGSSWFMYCWSLAWRILSITLLACEMSTVVCWSFRFRIKMPSSAPRSRCWSRGQTWWCWDLLHHMGPPRPHMTPNTDAVPSILYSPPPHWHFQPLFSQIWTQTLTSSLELVSFSPASDFPCSGGSPISDLQTWPSVPSILTPTSDMSSPVALSILSVFLPSSGPWMLILSQHWCSNSNTLTCGSLCPAWPHKL